VIKCSSCETVQQPSLLCAQCGAPIGAALDFFAALGLPRKLAINSTRLEQLYHDLGRRIHPDRFANGAAAALRDASLRGTALLTRAYRTLRDPVSRGLYWLELNGHKLADNNKSVPADLAETVFEVQEQLAELREARDGGGEGAAQLRGGVEHRSVELHGAIEAAQRELALNFARWDALPNSAQPDVRPDASGVRLDAPNGGLSEAGGGERDSLVAALKSILSKIAYLRTLLRDIDRELDSAEAA
jgi:molecular chaperone HscB